MQLHCMGHCMFAIYRTLYMSCIPVAARMARLSLHLVPKHESKTNCFCLLWAQAKRPRPELQKHFYRSIGSSEEDKQSFERNKNLLLREIESKKPNPKSLIVRTFAEQRKNILSGGQMVAALCTEYPFLKKAIYVSGLCIGPVASLQSHLPVI